MNWYIYISYISTVIWLIAALRQRKNDYSFLFWTLAIMDLVSGLVFLLLGRGPHKFMLGLLFVLPFTVYPAFIKKYIKYILPAFVIISLIGWYVSYQNFEYFVVVSTLIMIAIFSKLNIFVFFKNRSFDVTELLFLLYFLSVMTKYVSIKTDPAYGLPLFYTATIFQLLIGIYFIVRTDKIRIKI